MRINRLPTDRTRGFPDPARGPRNDARPPENRPNTAKTQDLANREKKIRAIALELEAIEEAHHEASLTGEQLVERCLWVWFQIKELETGSDPA